ncbi:MAG: hypothetical protein JWP72_894 [Massilia sp.]|nr:hypothetical protein [Massilia sp.]MDB5792796.1 hypothetical protein [Massilia sp.]
MSPFLRRLAPIAVLCLAILIAMLTATPARAHASGAPHLIHEYEGWVALAVVVLSLLGAGVLLRRSLRR